MALLDVGRVCKIVRGKYAREYCVIVDKPNKGMALIEGENVKRRSINIMHLEPLPIVLKIKKDAKGDAVLDALEKADLPG